MQQQVCCLAIFAASNAGLAALSPETVTLLESVKIDVSLLSIMNNSAGYVKHNRQKAIIISGLGMILLFYTEKIRKCRLR
jgi:hypothetical protein